MFRFARNWFRQHPIGALSACAALVTAVLVGGAGAQAGWGNHAAPVKKSHAHSADGKNSKATAHKKDKKKQPHATQSPSASPTPVAPPVPVVPGPVASPAPSAPAPANPAPSASKYPLHTGIVSTTFWVGEIFDANAEDGSQMLSTYDGNWFANYGGCDGISSAGVCKTEKRVASNGFFPSSMTPLQNPFYLDLPYDDVNDSTAFKNRGSTIPWANDAPYAGKAKDRSVSFMKNRWVKLMKDGQTCYGQVADAGPGEYHDAAYVFGSNDARPANSRYGGAGMDVSPALNGCLNFSELDGQSDKVDWQFVEAADVPAGPWLKVSSNSNAVID